MTAPGGPPGPPTLVGNVSVLVDTALRVYARGPAEPELRAIAARIAEPLRVAIAGRIKAGKSTLLNALVGQELAATDAGECTKIVTWYVDGHTYEVTLVPLTGLRRQVPFREEHGSLRIDLGSVAAEEAERLVVSWPSAALRQTTLIDTPGLGSLSTDVSARSEAVLAPEDGRTAVADAVVYLMRHVHGDDAAFLEAFRDGSVDRRAVNTIGVLARADEVGHARPDAMETAERVAARYRQDPRVRSLCHTVVPVAGLLASSAAGLREQEYRALAVLAGHPDTERLLLTADRFAQAESEVGVSVGERAALLGRLGMYGVRLAVDLIARGEVANASETARALVATSGLSRLRELLASQFAARADVLKARSALTALDDVLRRYPFAPAQRLVGDLERLRAGAHEFAEIALIDDIRARSVIFGSDEAAAAEMLLGGSGMDVHHRLDLPTDAGPDAVQAAATEQHRRWRRRAEHPASTREVAQAARVLVRTCEGILADPARGEYREPGPPAERVARYS